MSKRNPTVEQFRGCLLGQCLGDALGFLVEGQHPVVCYRYATELRQGKAGKHGRGPFPFGQYTDDSQLAREMMQSYLACDTFSPAHFATCLEKVFSEQRIVGYGQATLQAAKRLADGISWDEAGTPAPRAGNGTAMRAAPIGLFYFDDEIALCRNSALQSKITHKDPRCAAGATAIAGAVAIVLQEKTIDTSSFLETLSQWSNTHEPELAKTLLQLNDWLNLPPERAVGPISRAGILDDAFPPWPGISPFVVSSVLWSLYSFLKHPNDYWETICTAIAVGGDVDTTAAMAGAISGAYLGDSVIPQHLLDKLTDQGTWEKDDLCRLAEHCYQKKFSVH